ncbi:MULTISPECIES: hypothetical protein [unclassified Pseudomonas]|uniref:hypothetical protein n=1 Tax=unclassified Pseudomonas TaxID=196821 RepID=UPI001CBFF9C3|nr:MULTISPECIES: hypothetical protein [unclassified Pseudomonas]
MKTSNKIGKALAVAITLIIFGVSAEECKSTSSLITPHKLETKKNLICITKNNEEIAIFVYRNDGGGTPISRNTTLLDESDITEGSMRLESSSDGFQIYFEYPNNIYLIGFDIDAKHITKSYSLIKLNAASPDTPPKQMKLVVTSKQLAELHFETLTKRQVFGQNALNLEQPFNAIITTRKAQILHNPNSISFSGMHLIQGDSVRVIDFKNGWIKIQHESLDHLDDSGWILLADIL